MAAPSTAAAGSAASPRHPLPRLRGELHDAENVDDLLRVPPPPEHLVYDHPRGRTVTSVHLPLVKYERPPAPLGQAHIPGDHRRLPVVLRQDQHELVVAVHGCTTSRCDSHRNSLGSCPACTAVGKTRI